MSRTIVFFSLGLVVATVGSGCGDPDSCQNATVDIQKSLTAVCAEPDFINTPFCTCCVPAGMFSIDDTCTCKPLVFDADFCYYKVGSGGYPQVRAGLQYATSVCLGRPVSVPYGTVDAGMCVPTTSVVPMSSDAGAPVGD